MFGFTKVDFGSDHTLAAFLRKHKSIDNFQHKGNTVTWRDPNARAIVVCFYNNAEMSYVSWVRDDMAPAT